MYIPMFVIVIIVIAFIWHIGKRSNATEQNKELVEKGAYFDEKYKKDYDRINGYMPRLLELAKLFTDSINLKLIKNIIEEDPERYDEIGKRIKSGDKAAGGEYDTWAASSNYKDTQEWVEIKRMMNECSKKLDELFVLWPKLGNKFLTAKHPPIQETLDDILGAMIYTDALHREVSEKKYFNNDNTKEILKELEKLDNRLKEVLLSCKERYYEDNE